MIRPALAAVLALAVSPAPAQHAPGASPYAGMQGRPVKALSEAQVADLRAGRGMGLALPAELNGYPGPSHALELADGLGLTDAQRARTEALFAAMQAEAVRLGEDVLAREAELDAAFAARTITRANLALATEAAGVAQARLRAAHLRYHLAMVEVLSPGQVRRYAELRGYAGGAAPAAPAHGGHGVHRP